VLSYLVLDKTDGKNYTKYLILFGANELMFPDVLMSIE
jgi:hypothetical protein